MTKRLFYHDLENEVVWDDDKRFSSTLIWNGMMIKGPLLLRSGIRWRSKVLFYFDLEWDDNQMFFSTLIWNGMAIKGPVLLIFEI